MSAYLEVSLISKNTFRTTELQDEEMSQAHSISSLRTNVKPSSPKATERHRQLLLKDMSRGGIFYRKSATTLGSAVIGGSIGGSAGPVGVVLGAMAGGAIGFAISRHETSKR